MIKYLSVSVIQGAADAFKETELPTGLVNLGTTAYRIRSIEFSMPNLISTAANNMQASLTRKSFSAIPSIAAPALIAKQDIGRNFGTNVGVSDQNLIMRIDYPRDLELVIVEDPLYAQFDSAATGNANTCIIRIGYELRQISTVERLALIAASLQ